MANPTDIINSVTVDHYVKGRWENFKSNNPFFGVLEKKAHIVTGVSGQQLNWRVRAGTYAAVITGDYQDVSAQYVPNRQYINPTLPWGEVSQFDAISKGEFAKNDGDEAIVKLRDYRLPDMVDDLLNRGSTSMAYQILRQDGPAYTGNGDPIYGLPSFQATSATSSSSPTATAGDTYAGFTTALSGITTVTNPVANAWTPLLVNTTNSTFGSGASAKTNILEYLSYGMQNVTFDGSDPTQKPSMGILASDLFSYGRLALGAKQTIMLTSPVSADDAWGVGNSVERFMHDGVPFFWDSNMAAGEGDILNMEQIWLYCLKVPARVSGDSLQGKQPSRKDMFDCEVNYNDGRRGVTVSITFRGQLAVNPRFQCHLKAYA